jgi:hypothetical protein
MSMLLRLPQQAVRPDPWTLFCAECSQKMRITMAIPAQEGRETRIYECACSHRETISVILPDTRTPQRRPRSFALSDVAHSQMRLGNSSKL